VEKAVSETVGKENAEKKKGSSDCLKNSALQSVHRRTKDGPPGEQRKGKKQDIVKIRGGTKFIREQKKK